MSRRRPPRWNGLLPVAKNTGPTSHDIVDIARRSLRERRIGHTGTLDPMAQGLLLLCVGKATRLQQYLLGWEKEYRGEIRLGWSTDTYDTEGEATTPKVKPPEISSGQLSRLQEKYSGDFEQLPPAYSAKKIGGKKAYELARKGEDVPVQAHAVHVHSLSITQTTQELLSVRMSVASGFYVRSLAHDIGKALGCGAHLCKLERLRIGPFKTENAISQAELEAVRQPEEIIEGERWIRLEKAPLPFPTLEINPGAAERFINGQEIVALRNSDLETAKDEYLGVACRSRLLGVGRVQHVLARGRTLGIRPSLVLNTEFYL